MVVLQADVCRMLMLQLGARKAVVQLAESRRRRMSGAVLQLVVGAATMELAGTASRIQCCKGWL